MLKLNQRAINEFMIRRKRVIICIITILFVLAAATPFIISSVYDRPCVDDYSYSYATVEVIRSGGGLIELLNAAVETSAHFMQSWQGLYSSAFLLSLQPAIFGEEYYGLTGPILMVFSLVGFLTLLFSLSKYVLRSNSRSWIAVGLIAWSLFLVSMPSTSQGLYWFNGAVNYMVFWSLACMALSLALRYYSRDVRSIPTLIVTSFLSFFVAGGNHVTSFALILMLGFLVAVGIKSRRRIDLIVPFIFCVVGFLIVITAPGTAVRANALGVDSSVVWTLLASPVVLMRDLLTWIDIRLLVALGAMTPFVIDIIKKQSPSTRPFSFKKILITCILSLAFLAALLCVPLYSLRSWGADRLTNVIYATFLILVIVIFVMCVQAVLRKWPDTISRIIDYARGKASRFVVFYALALALILVIFPFNSNWVTAVKQLWNGSMETYATELDARLDDLRDPSVEDAVFSKLSVKPSTIYFDDITEDEDDWRNVALSRYYGKDSVRLE